MVELLFKELSELKEVEAIALGGSRAGENYDEKSDYDVYVYVNSPISEKDRKNILNKFCKYMEIGNHFWEYEDNCILNNQIEIDILYRNMEDFMQDIENIAVKCQARNSYTTCMWHNLRTCKILYDENGNLTKYKEKYSFDYPEQLKKNIDMIFAINSLTHPGEKRLIQLCKKQCKILPENFEENLELLFSHMFSRKNQAQCIEAIENIVKNIKKII